MCSRRRWVFAFVVLVTATSSLPPGLPAQTRKVPGDAAKSPSDSPAAKKSNSDSDGLKDALLREVKEAFDALDGMAGQDSDREDGFLRDADAALTRIRSENRRAWSKPDGKCGSWTAIAPTSCCSC